MGNPREGKSFREDVEAWAAGEDFSDARIYANGSPDLVAFRATTGRRLQQVKEMMLWVHRSSGHSSLDHLSRLLLRRGAPEWAVSLAKNLSCAECEESKRKVGPPRKRA